ncbi:MAG TPA: hypothetical protein VEU47_11550 [Candidatus Cybelea sp.]|nr:hypothetical protein [Candidatus Cybelea sp.]
MSKIAPVSNTHHSHGSAGTAPVRPVHSVNTGNHGTSQLNKPTVVHWTKGSKVDTKA